MLSGKLKTVLETVSEDKYLHTEKDEDALELAVQMTAKISDKFQMTGAEIQSAVAAAFCQLSKFVLQNWDKLEGGNEAGGADD